MFSFLTYFRDIFFPHSNTPCFRDIFHDIFHYTHFCITFFFCTPTHRIFMTFFVTHIFSWRFFLYPTPRVFMTFFMKFFVTHIFSWYFCFCTPTHHVFITFSWFFRYAHFVRDIFFSAHQHPAFSWYFSLRTFFFCTTTFHNTNENRPDGSLSFRVSYDVFPNAQ